MDQSEFPVPVLTHITFPVLGYDDEMPEEETPDGAQIIKVRCAPTGAAGAICAPRARLYVCKHEPSRFLYVCKHVPLAWCRHTAKPRGNEVRVKVEKAAKAKKKKDLSPLEAEKKKKDLSPLEAELSASDSGEDKPTADKDDTEDDNAASSD
jgi:hypothetical protein